MLFASQILLIKANLIFIYVKTLKKGLHVLIFFWKKYTVKLLARET